MRETIESLALFSSEGFLFTNFMSTMRSVDTRFWSDVWVRKLNALDRYVFLYLLTNQHSTWCGVYELDIGMMAFECGVDVHDLEKSILPRLLPKIVYIDGWVCIKNFDKYHKNNSEQTRKGIENAWALVPEDIRLKIKTLSEKPEKKRPPTGGIQGASPSSFASSSSFTSALASSSVSEQSSQGDLIPQIIKAFETVNPACKRMYGIPTQRKACGDLIESYGLDEVLKVIDVLPQTNGMEYVPVVTTPLQLRDKWVQLGTALKRTKVKKQSEVIIMNNNYDKNKSRV